jgi:ABC-type Fe3+/spermidine/putrescine transport system ATPase subunit
LPNQLSGGQQQRVAVARALVYDPSVLLMDEPLGALDKKLREGLQAELRRIHRDLGITMVFVTHDQEEALALSDRIVVFEQGRIVQVGTTAELYRRPATPFVASFVGDSNLLSGAVVEVGGEQALDSPVGRIPLPSTAAGRERATVLIRPEHVRQPSATGGLELVLPMVVEDQAFLGPFTLVTCRSEDGTQIKMRCPANEGDHLAPGDRVELGWRRGDVLLLDEDPVPPGDRVPTTTIGTTA